MMVVARINKTDLVKKLVKERIVAALEHEIGPDARHKVEAILTAANKREVNFSGDDKRVAGFSALSELTKSDETKKLISDSAKDLGLEPPRYEDDGTRFALSAQRSPRLLEPELAEVHPVSEQRPPPLLPPLLPRPAAVQIFGDSFEDAARRYEAASARQQGLYLAASGTLMQLNAIVAGILGVLLVSAEKGLLKTAVAIALSLHVLAAFVLCWAARPVGEQEEYGTPRTAMTVVYSYARADDTFRHYRRGWRLTLLALAISSAAAGLFLLHAFGIAVLE
jgi:hypothetical protein